MQIAYGGKPPSAATVWLYGVLRVPFGSVLGPTSKMVMLRFVEAAEAMVSESLTCTLKFVGVPGVVGVPEMTPLLLLSVLMVRPGGRPPWEPSSQLPLVSITHQV